MPGYLFNGRENKSLIAVSQSVSQLVCHSTMSNGRRSSNWDGDTNISNGEGDLIEYRSLLGRDKRGGGGGQLSSHSHPPPSALTSSTYGRSGGGGGGNGQHLHVRFALTPTSSPNENEPTSLIPTANAAASYISRNQGRSKNNSPPLHLNLRDNHSHLQLNSSASIRQEQKPYHGNYYAPQEHEDVAAAATHRRRYQSESSAGKGGRGDSGGEESITGMLNNFSKALGKSFKQILYRRVRHKSATSEKHSLLNKYVVLVAMSS
jgi:hypothetical protein